MRNYSLVEERDIVLYNQMDMKLSLRHILIADMVILDQLTNKVSAIGLFDLINIPFNKESSIISFSITAQLIFSEIPTEEKISVKLQLLKPSGVLEKEVEMDFITKEVFMTDESPARLPLIVRFNAIEFKSEDAGNYSISILVNGNKPEVDSIASFQLIKHTE